MVKRVCALIVIQNISMQSKIPTTPNLLPFPNPALAPALTLIPSLWRSRAGFGSGASAGLEGGLGLRLRAGLVTFLLLLAYGDVAIGQASLETKGYTGQVPMVMMASSGTEGSFHVLRPKGLPYRYTISRIGSDTKPLVFTPYLSAAHPKLHWAIDKVAYTALIPATEYLIKIDDGRSTLDQRRFKTPDIDNNKLHFVFGSCSSDEPKYRQIAKGTWSLIERLAPDFLFLIGDNVYG